MPMMYIKRSIWSGFEIKNWNEDQFQSSPKLVGIWIVLRCVFVPNLEIVTSIGGELWHGQAQNGVNLDFQVKFDLEDQGGSVHKTIGTLTKVFCIFGPNLAILAWTGPELSRGQASDWHRQTDRQTHTQTQVTTIPETQNWPRVKTNGCPGYWKLGCASSICPRANEIITNQIKKEICWGLNKILHKEYVKTLVLVTELWRQNFIH